MSQSFPPSAVCRLPSILLSLLITLLSLPNTVFSQAADTLTLKNGTSVWGEFKAWKQGEVKFKTKGLGTVYVEIDDLKSLDGMRKEYRVVSTKGKIYYGKIGNMTDDQIHVIDAKGDHYIPFDQIMDITLYTPKQLMPLDGAVGAGYNFSLGNDVGILNLDLEAIYEFKNVSLDISGTSSMVQKDGDLTRTRDELEVNAFRILGPRWQVGAKGLYQKNTKQGLDSRALLGAGPLYRAVMSKRGEMWLFAGFSMSKESAVGGGSQIQPEFPVLLNARIYSFNKPELSFQTTQVVYIDPFKNFGTRHEGDLKLRWEFLDDFSLTLSGYSTYDPKPITSKGKKWDTGVKTGIEFEF
jgi:hypothetical protein